MDEKKDNVIEFADTPEEDNENKETSEAADRSSADKSAADKSAADTSVADTSADNNLPLTMRQTTAQRKMTGIYMTTKRETVKTKKKLRLSALK